MNSKQAAFDRATAAHYALCGASSLQVTRYRTEAAAAVRDYAAAAGTDTLSAAAEVADWVDQKMFR